MRKTFIVIAVGLALALLSVPSAHAVTAEMGNEAVDRATRDYWRNFTIVDTNNPAPFDGTFDRIDFHAERAGTIRFVIVGTDDDVLWISDEVTPDAPGVHTFTPDQPVGVTEGSNIGVYSPGQGVVSYDWDGEAAPAEFTGYDSGQPAVGDVLDYYDTSGRFYSMGMSIRASSPDVCKKGGWERWGYRNQGQCIASVVANGHAGKS